MPFTIFCLDSAEFKETDQISSLRCYSFARTCVRVFLHSLYFYVLVFAYLTYLSVGLSQSNSIGQDLSLKELSVVIVPFCSIYFFSQTRYTLLTSFPFFQLSESPSFDILPQSAFEIVFRGFVLLVLLVVFIFLSFFFLYFLFLCLLVFVYSIFDFT